MTQAGHYVATRPVRLPRTPRRPAPGGDAAAVSQPREVGLPDLVDQWGLDSFPASDPPANW